MDMLSINTKRNVCGTAEAASIYGCAQAHVRRMAILGQIWSQKIGARAVVVDADEIRRLAKERDQLRKKGKLCGRRPGDRKTA
jgi:hypothetical protein